MSADDNAHTRMIAKYRDLISDFVDGRITTQQFESAYLQLFKTDTAQVPGHEFDVLEELFFAVDDYVADPGLRRQVGGLDEEQLRAPVEAAPIEETPAEAGPFEGLAGGPAGIPPWPHFVHTPGSIDHRIPILGEDDPGEDARDFRH